MEGGWIHKTRLGRELPAEQQHPFRLYMTEKLIYSSSWYSDSQHAI